MTKEDPPWLGPTEKILTFQDPVQRPEISGRVWAFFELDCQLRPETGPGVKNCHILFPGLFCGNTMTGFWQTSNSEMSSLYSKNIDVKT